MFESQAERQERLLLLAKVEKESEDLHEFLEALSQKPEVSESIPGVFARALHRLGWQSKLALMDPVSTEQSMVLKNVKTP
jgi:hypothetical protein